MTCPCGKIRIPLNESQDDQSQIEEFLREYHGEGIQHVALGTAISSIPSTSIRARGITFQDTPDTYYEQLPRARAGPRRKPAAAREARILMDGAPTEGQGLLLQIFTQNMIGPIFFEIIQRKGNEGFGEGNFKALFESIELDQMRRGVSEPMKYVHWVAYPILILIIAFLAYSSLYQALELDGAQQSLVEDQSSIDDLLRYVSVNSNCDTTPQQLSG